VALRVVITGIGVVSPIGCTRDSFWRSCVEGRSGVKARLSPWITETGVGAQIAAYIDDFDPAQSGMTPKQTRVLDRTVLFALTAAGEALEDAGFELSRSEKKDQLRVHGVESRRLATLVGSGIGGITSMERSHALWRETRSKSPIKRYALPMLIPNAPAAQVAIRFGARGECKSVSTACAAGTMSIGDAYRLIRDGEADVALAGGAEGVAGDHDAYAQMGFDRLRMLSTRNDEPQRASRPFDLDRDGFVLGEGAGILTLESEGHARARGARIYAEIAGYASNCDAHSIMALEESGDSIVVLIEQALRSAGLQTDDVDYISAHGTATQLNDKTESRVVRRVFGARADEIPLTALKSMTGHGIASGGPMETAAAALSLHEGILTPTINYETPDPECDVNVVANRAQRSRPQCAIKLSYGFGGHNACLVLVRR